MATTQNPTFPMESVYRLDIESPVGWWRLSSTETVLLSMDYSGLTAPENFRPQAETRLEQRLACMLSRYFRGESVNFATVPILLTGSAFQQSVLGALRQVPFGAVRSYQWLAEASGNARATRAVGGALGGNPLPVIIPCHRIVTIAGALGGFMRGSADGLRLKSFLLGVEGVCLDNKGRLGNLITVGAP